MNRMSEFHKVAKVSEIADPGCITVECDERIVVVFLVEGSYYCLDDVCTHDGGPLGDGPLTGCEIACPRHGAKFDIRTGKAITMPATQDTQSHEVRIEGEDVLVKLR